MENYYHPIIMSLLAAQWGLENRPPLTEKEIAVLKRRLKEMQTTLKNIDIERREKDANKRL